MNSASVTKRITFLALFTALGVTIAPFFWFQFLATKAFPGQHLVNGLAGVIIGPWWAGLAAVFIGIIRNMLGIGTVYAFPGGIPGAIVVGLIYKVTKRFDNRLAKYSAVLFEPVGTVIIGGTLSLLLVAPLMGHTRLTDPLAEMGLAFLPIFWAGWAASSVPGAIISYIVLLALDRMGVISHIMVVERVQRSAQT